MELFELFGTVAVNTQDAIKDIKETSKQSQDLSADFEKTATKASEFSAKVLAATEAVVTAIGGMALASSTSMETAIDSFASSTGIAGEELEGYQDVMKEIYSENYGKSFEDVAEAMAKIKQQAGDIGADELKSMTTDALLLRDTFDFEVNESTRAAKMLMDQFGLSSKEAFNLIAQGAQKGLDKNGDMLDSINEYAVHYKQMGYSAEQFFNSLSNGSEAGTFSVDKLGDAMKEFGIRVKDTSTTTTDAFKALGYGSTDAEDAIHDTQLEIAELEKKLRYAKLEQEGFNDKTSELTRMKNADKIAQYSAELDGLKNTLEVLSEDTTASLGSISDLQARFAAGGETAREATEEVLTALYSMDDKVQQNAIGVGLFGTMWEDLGIDGIKALTEVEGGIETATDALTEMSEVKYDNLTSEIDGLKRKFETSIITPLGKKIEPIVSNLIKKVEQKMPQTQKLCEKLGGVVEKGFEKLEPAVEWLIDDAFPVLVDILEFCIENFETLVGVVATFYGVVKSLTIISEITTVVKNASGAFEIFNGILASNPIGAVVTAVGLLAVGIGALVDSMGEEEDQLADTKEKIEEERIAREERLQAIQDEKDAIDKKAESELTEIAHVENLWGELQTLCDAQGKVAEADKTRAEFILNELNEALGTEYKMTGNQIQNYKDLKTAVNEAIEAKKAEILLSAQEEKYRNAITAIQEKEKLLAQSKIELKDQTEKATKAENDYYETKENGEKRLRELEEQAAIMDASANRDQAALDAIYAEINATLDTIEEKELAWAKEKLLLEGKEQAYADQKSVVEDYYQDMADYENASALILEGNTSAAVELLDSMGRSYQKASDLAEENAETQLAVLKDQMKQAQVAVDEIEGMLAKADDSNRVIHERQLESAKRHLENCQSEYKKAGGIIPESLIEGYEHNHPAWNRTFQKYMDTTAKSLDIGGFEAVGEQISEGIVTGVQNNSTKAKKSLVTFVKDMLATTKDAAQIKSPSRLFAREVGEFIPSGVALGIEENKEDALDSVDNMVGLMASSGQKATGGMSATFSTSMDVSAIVEKLNQLIAVMTQQRIYLNGDVLVGELAPAMNTELGNISTLTERGQ